MSEFISFQVTNAGVPVTGLVRTPAQWFPFFGDRDGNARTRPAVVEVGSGTYGFTLTDGDQAEGVCFVIDAGATAAPRYQSGQSSEDEDPFVALLLLTEAGALYGGATIPTVDSYKDQEGNNRTAPALVEIDTYLYTLAPSADDLLVGTVFHVDCPAGVAPTGFDGDFDATAGAPPFGVTPAKLRRSHFTALGDFSANSNPNTETVTETILEENSDLVGMLLVKGISAASLEEDGNGWSWCAKTLKLMAAIAVGRNMTGLNPDVVVAWEKQLEKRLAKLEADGGLALGEDVGSEDEPPQGPTHHIDTLDLDVGDEADDASDVIPRFRRSDAL